MKRLLNLGAPVYTMMLLVLLLTSCQEDPTPSQWEIMENKEESAKKGLGMVYGIRQDWDTLKWEYSIDFQDAPSNLFLSGDATLHDIVRVDSAIRAIVVLGTGDGDAYLSLKVNSEEAQELRERGSHVIAFRLNHIRKVRSTLETECGEDYSYTYTEASRDFIGSGELLDVALVPYGEE